MNTTVLKEASKYLMIGGATIFTCGFGMNFACNMVEKKELRLAHYERTNRLQEEATAKKALLEQDALVAATERDKEYTKKLMNMNQTDFAKFHAAETAKANDDVLLKAESIRKKAEAEVVHVKMECTDTIEAIKAECLAKIAEANKKRDEALEKYNQIDSLFTNKNDILRAKEALEAAARKDEKLKSDKEDLMNAIKELTK